MARPNVLLLHTDQHRWDALGANGNEEIHTPNLDRLAEEGVNFDRYFVQSPVCAPSRESYLTGQYPSQLGIYTNGVPLPEDTPTIATLFSDAGYETANIGKLHFQPHANRDHTQPHPDYGFDHLTLSETPGVYHDAYRAWVRSTHPDPDTLEELSVGLSPGARVWQELMDIEDDIGHPERVEGASEFQPRPFGGPDEATHTAFVAERTIQYLEEHMHNRFLCVSGFFAPHQPYVVPQRFLDRYDRDGLSIPDFPPEVETKRSRMDGFDDEELRAARHGYYALVSEVDHHVGRILDRLDELGLADETIVVFTADHGEYLGDHLQYAKGFPGEDCISRVPLAIRWPEGVESPGRTVSDLVEAVDLLPTLLASAGLPVPSHLRGESLLPALRDEAFDGKDVVVHEGGGDRLAGRSIRTDRFRYVLWKTGEDELYDLAEKYGEYRDVSEDAAYADHVSELRHRMLCRLTEITPRQPREYVY